MNTRARNDALLYAAQGVKVLMEMPTGSVATEVAVAYSAKAQALADLAMAYALLDVADAVRETNRQEQQ